MKKPEPTAPTKDKSHESDEQRTRRRTHERLTELTHEELAQISGGKNVVWAI